MAPRPVRLTNPVITLTNKATTPVTVELTCYCSGVHLVPEEDDALATLCDPYGYKQVLTLDLKQSLGADGLDALLWSLGGPGTLVEFEFAYFDDGITPASADNPHWTGETRLTAWAVVDAGINEPTDITLEMDVIGEVTRDPVGVTP